MLASTKSTYEQMYIQLTNLLDGVQIDDTLFGVLLNMVRTTIEMEIPWMVLKKIDKSQSASLGDTWQTPKALPSDFINTIDGSAIQLFDGTNNQETYTEVVMENQLDYKDSNGVFWVDYAGGNYYLGGVVDKQYQIWFPYIADFGGIVATITPSPVPAQTNNVWQNFPARFDMILPYGVSVLQKAGIDFDDQNARMALYNDKTYQAILSNMKKWNSRLQLQTTQNVDYHPFGESRYRRGAIDIYNNNSQNN